MKKIIFLLLLIPSITFAKDFKMQGSIKNYHSAKVYLCSVYGDKLNIIDSTLTDRNGNFNFVFGEEKQNGMYRLFFANNKKIDLLYNFEDIVFESNVTDPVNGMHFKQSVENTVYYNYLLRRNYDQYRLELLQPVLMYYPKTDAFFKTISSEFNAIQKGLTEFTRDLLFRNKDTYAAKFIAMEQKPLLLPDLNPQQQQLYLKEHYFDKVKFDDASLLRSNAITTSVLSYLSLHQNQNFTKDQLEREFMKAVDVILSKTKNNIEIHNFVIEYLINGFESYGFDNVITHMAEWLSNPENCELPESSSLQDRLNTIKKLAPGRQAPNIIGQDLDGNTVILNKIDSKYTLLVFWASWCPHCTEIIPKVHDYYLDVKDELEVLSISIDTSQVELDNFLKTFNPDWRTMADFKGWDGKTAIDYGIHSTPTMILLDENKKIIGNIDTPRELKNKLK